MLLVEMFPYKVSISVIGNKLIFNGGVKIITFRTLFCKLIIFNGNIASQSVWFRKYSILVELRK
jgi:hypothetical protein